MKRSKDSILRMPCPRYTSRWSRPNRWHDCENPPADCFQYCSQFLLPCVPMLLWNSPACQIVSIGESCELTLVADQFPQTRKPKWKGDQSQGEETDGQMPPVLFTDRIHGQHVTNACGQRKDKYYERTPKELSAKSELNALDRRLRHLLQLFDPFL